MLFVFVIHLFGTRIMLRTLDDLICEQLVKPALRESFLFIVFLIQAGFFYFEVTKISSAWFVTLIPVFFVALSKKILVLKRKKGFRDKFCHFLDHVILEMRSGKGFRAALSPSLPSLEVFERNKVARMCDRLRFQSEELIGETYLDELMEDLRLIDQNSHNNLQRVLNLRWRLRVESDYRRKSGQAVGQIRAQAMVLVVLYFATLLFVLSENSWKDIFTELLVSAVLFVTGTLIVFLYGRRYRWKV